jgi:integrase
VAKAENTGRRTRIETGIYVRSAADGKPVYEIGWRDARGRQRWRRVQGGIKAARAALAEAHTARARGERVATDPRLRFEDAAGAWWQSEASRLRPATRATYESALKHVLEQFGRTRLTDVTPGDVAAFIAAQERRGYKGWTIKGHLTVVSSVFRYAGRHLGFAGGNPLALLERSERPSIEDQRPKRVLNPDELQRLIKAVDEPYRLLFESTAETGGRLGEMLGLVWGNVDLADATVTFTHQLGKRAERVPLKTKRSRRCIEITPQLASKLRAHKLASNQSGDHDFVFTTRQGTPHDHRNIGGRVLARAVKNAGLEEVVRNGQVVEPAPTFHNLRHSHGSALIANGWDIEEVSARLGHANVAVTQQAYVHAYDAARRSDERRSRLSALYPDETSGSAANAVSMIR